MIYTSGTTAEPKGVVHTNGALVRHGEALRRLGAIVEGDRVLAAMPFFWVGGLSRTLGPAMHAGATLLTQTRFDADGALELIETEKATDIAAWETVLRRIVDHPRFDASSMRHDPRVRRGGLGMTETCGQHTWRRPGEDPASVGSAVPGVEHRVVEPGTERTVPVGMPGEICVRGYCVCTAMIKRERHEVFDSDGWYHTGDGGWIDESGQIHFDTRLTDMIKTDGNNVAPAEIESTLLAHPSISFAVVFGIAHPTKGEEPAAVVVAGAEPPSGEELQGWLRTHLAPYKVPRRILFLTNGGDVPLLASGKPDKIHLASMLGESAS
jgi:acyl-CoA synthetase (AMP-forming)/AMP-acid ligase II